MGNTWDRNTGNRNTGHRNTGSRNTGSRNTGYRNTGHKNTGDRNTGHRNTGDRNTGYRNTGYLNTGDRNAGDFNAGYRNTGDFNTGYLNTDTPKVRIFWVQTNIEQWSIEFPGRFYFDTLVWVSEWEMTDAEKKLNPEYSSTDWYLKRISDKENKDEYMKDCWRLAFDRCEDLWDIKSTLEIPHFTYDKFEEISWISEADFTKKLWVKTETVENTDTIVVNGVTYKRV